MPYAPWEMWAAVLIGLFGWDVARYCWRRATGKIGRKGERL